MLEIEVVARYIDGVEFVGLGAVGIVDDRYDHQLAILAEPKVRNVEIHRKHEFALAAGDIEVRDGHPAMNNSDFGRQQRSAGENEKAKSCQ